MKKITIYSLDGCNTCKHVTQKVLEIISGKEIDYENHNCHSLDTECDRIEDKLDTGKYPMIRLDNFSYFKNKYTKSSGMLYFSNRYSDEEESKNLDKNTIAVSVLSTEELLEKIKVIINEKTY
jgi:hypothetical protein